MPAPSLRTALRPAHTAVAEDDLALLAGYLTKLRRYAREFRDRLVAAGAPEPEALPNGFGFTWPTGAVALVTVTGEVWLCGADGAEFTLDARAELGDRLPAVLALIRRSAPREPLRPRSKRSRPPR